MHIKTQFVLFTFLLALLLMPTIYAKPSSQIKNSHQTIILNVQNITCPMCKFTIKKILSSVPGTEKVTVHYKNKTATVIFDPIKTNINTIINTTTNAGFPATVKFTEK